MDAEGAARARLPAWAAVAAVVFALGWLFGDFRTRTGWDDTFYLLQVSSVVEDGDLDLRNDALYSRLAPRDLKTFLTSTLPSGALKNTFSIGTTVLWLPAYAAARPWSHGARWSRAQLEALHFLSLAFLAGVGWFLYRLLAAAGGDRGDHGDHGDSAAPADRADHQVALLGMMALLLGTPLAVYGPAVYTMAHLPSAFAACLFVASLLWLERDARPYRALLAGVALGLLFLARWQDAVFGLLLWVPLAPLLHERRGLTRLAKLLAAVTAGALAMALLQFHAWRVELGSWLTMPQGGDYMRWSRPHLREFLLSGYSGLLPWSPVFALGIAGLLLPWRCRLSPRWRVVALLVLAAEIYVNSAVSDWWGGDSFGARRMTSCVPLLAIGLANLAAAAVTRHSRRLLVLMLAALAVWGCFTTNLYWRHVRDLSVVVRGSPSIAAREVPPDNDAINDPALARRQALRLAVAWLHDDFAGLPGIRRSVGILLTAALMAAAVAGTCFLLAGRRRALLLQLTLLVLLGTALWVHLLLAGGPRPDPGERALWRRTAASVNEPRRDLGAVAAAAAAEAALLDARAGQPARLGRPGRSARGSPADAYRFLALLAGLEAGEPPRAMALLDGLAGRGYPAALALRQEIRSRAPDGATLRILPGSFFEPRQGAASRTIALPATEPPASALPATGPPAAGQPATEPPAAGTGAGELGSLEIVFDLRLGVALEPGAIYDVATLQDGSRAELARIALRGTSVVQLTTPRSSTDAALPSKGSPYRLRLRHDPRAGVASLEVIGPDGSRVRLSCPLAAGGMAPARLLLGRDRQGHASFPLWSSTFSDLWVTASAPAG